MFWLENNFNIFLPSFVDHLPLQSQLIDYSLSCSRQMCWYYLKNKQTHPHYLRDYNLFKNYFAMICETEREVSVLKPLRMLFFDLVNNRTNTLQRCQKYDVILYTAAPLLTPLTKCCNIYRTALENQGEEFFLSCH